MCVGGKSRKSRSVKLPRIKLIHRSYVLAIRYYFSNYCPTTQVRLTLSATISPRWWIAALRRCLISPAVSRFRSEKQWESISMVCGAHDAHVIYY